jgi:protease-4
MGYRIAIPADVQNNSAQGIRNMLFCRNLPVVLVLGVLTGCGTPSFLITPVPNINRLQEVQVQPGQGFRPGKVAITEIEGMLVNARTGGFLQPTENKLSLFTQQMERAANDAAVRAVVLRVNSPGGTVTASDVMYQTILRFRSETGKPVVASTQEVAASGAYYIACAADRIVAHPTSVIGSVGVVFNTFDASGTMSMVGLRSEAIKSGEFKDMGSPLRAISPGERQIMQGMVDEYHARFVDVITRHRPIHADRLAECTDGRVFSGQRAVELKLVDQVGLLDDAIDLAKELAGAPRASVIMYKRPYGYRGSIYADASTPEPRANVLTLELPDGVLLPRGFYYLWQP